MITKRFNRTITGEIYDSQNDDFVDEDYVDKPIGYEDGVIILLNDLYEENQKKDKVITHLMRIIHSNEPYVFAKAVEKNVKEMLK